MHAPNTLSGKKYAQNNYKVYALNKQVSKYMVMAFFSSNTGIFSCIYTGYLPCMCFVHLALLDYTMPDHLWYGQSVAWC